MSGPGLMLGIWFLSKTNAEQFSNELVLYNILDRGPPLKVRDEGRNVCVCSVPRACLHMADWDIQVCHFTYVTPSCL